MRIAVCGTQCIGKSTFVKDFIANWPMYTTPEKRYMSLKEDNKDLVVNEEGNEDSQRAILNFMCDQVMTTKPEDNIIYDRCVLDNLVYTMWQNAKEKVNDDFVKETISIVKNTLIFYDIIFFCPITAHTPINLEERDNRSVDPVYREEIDNIFKSVMWRYVQNDKTFFPFDAMEYEKGCPGIVELFGNREERIMLARMYVNDQGKMFGEDESALGDMGDAADLQSMINNISPNSVR